MTTAKTSAHENSNAQLLSEWNQKICVLHVDDDESFLKVSKQILESESNLQVDLALTVEEAFSQLAKQHYDAIVSDYEMPQENGLEFLKKVRETDKLIPFILFTGKGREDVAIQALNMGASRYISKHGSPETVYGELNYAIRHAYANAKAQASLQTSERRFSILAAATFEGIAFSQHGKIVDSNPQLSKMFGYEPFELTKLAIMNLVEPQSREFVSRKIKEKNEGPYECLSLRKDNSVFPVEIRTKKIPYKEKTALMFSFLDISERKKAENELLASQELQTKLFMESADAIFVANRENGTIVDCNTAALKLLGRKKREVIGKSQAFLHPKESNNSLFTEGFKKHVCGESYVEETQIVTKNGKLKDVAISSSAFNLGNEKLIQGTFREIKDCGSAEKLRTLKEFNDRIINSLEAALLVIDPRTYKIIDANVVAQKHAKLTKKKLIGKKCYEVTHQKAEPCQPPEHECPIRELLKTGKSSTVEHTHADRKHNLKHVEVSAYPMTDPEGLPVIVHVEKDITERKRLEHALLMSEKNFRSVSNSLKEALMLIDSEGNIEFWNPAAEKMFGYTSNEVVGKSFHQFIAPAQQRTSIKEGMKNFQATGQGAFLGKTMEITALRKDGKEIPIELSISSFQLENDKKAVGVARDISERKTLEEKLQSETTIWKRTF
ncbi:MAG: PAS domain S-box protein, partial [Chloroflexi bacterium]|nr:PAS domain S-box protein [Chloroflexota bacterium]